MSKKVRRVRRTNNTEKSNKATDKEVVKLTTEEQFAKEYDYVIKDLRRVFILAGAMFLLLIVLNVALKYIS